MAPRTNMQRSGDRRPLSPDIRRSPESSPPESPPSTSIRPAGPPPPPCIVPMVPRRRRIFLSAHELALQTHADELTVTQLSQIRFNMTEYDAHHPAAVQVRMHLGATKWEKLERYRACIANFAAFMRKLERESLTVSHVDLDRDHYPRMKKYVKNACGRYLREIFECHHDTMEEMIEYDAEEHVGIREGSSMVTVREYFYRRPFLWFMYNLYFPITGRRGDKGRMTWVELKDWAIETLLNPTEEPSWFTWLRASELVPVPVVTPQDYVWNAALIEAYTDVGTRFDEASAEFLARLRQLDGVSSS